MPGVGYLLAALAVTFTILDPRFASAPNLLNIGTQSSTLLLLALPMTLIIMSEGLDLSMGAVLGLSGVVLAMRLASGGSLIAALSLAVAVGIAFGVANGLLVVRLGIPPFITTLGTLVHRAGRGAGAHGRPQRRRHRQRACRRSTPAPGSACRSRSSSRRLVYAVFHFVLYRTPFGVYVFAIGGNRESLVLAGVRANLYHVGLYAIGGAMAGSPRCCSPRA